MQCIAPPRSTFRYAVAITSCPSSSSANPPIPSAERSSYRASLPTRQSASAAPPVDPRHCRWRRHRLGRHARHQRQVGASHCLRAVGLRHLLAVHLNGTARLAAHPDRAEVQYLATEKSPDAAGLLLLRCHRRTKTPEGFHSLMAVTVARQVAALRPVVKPCVTAGQSEVKGAHARRSTALTADR